MSRNSQNRFLRSFAAAGAVLVLAIVAVLVGLRLFWQPQILLQVVELHLRSPLRLLLVLLAAAAGGWFVFFFEKGKSSNRNRGNR